MRTQPEEPEQSAELSRQRAKTTAERGALTGAMISSVFAVAWSFWGSSGLHFFVALCVQLAATLLGLVIIISALRRQSRSTTDTSSRNRPFFSSRAFVVVVVAEVLAIGGGNLILTLTGQEQFRIALVSAIVGLHFLVFGRLFWPGFYWLGGALLVVAGAGTVVGMITDEANLILAITGLGSAASLFIAAVSPLVRRQRA